MKNILYLLVFLLLSFSLNAQNPYEQFGVEGKILQTEFEQQGSYLFEIESPDENSSIKRIEFDFSAMRYKAYGENDSLLLQGAVELEIPKRWMSPDPLRGLHPDQSPYLAMGANPVFYIDPNGLSQTNPNDYNGPFQVNEDGSLDFDGSHFIQNPQTGLWQYATQAATAKPDVYAEAERKYLERELNRRFIANNAFNGIFKTIINEKIFWGYLSDQVSPYESEYVGIGETIVLVSDISHGLVKKAGKQKIGKKIIRFRKFKDNFRTNLKRLTGLNPSSDIHAHHIFPQYLRHRFFLKGIDVDDPFFGVWVDMSKHMFLHNTEKYNDYWREYLKKGPTPTEILDRGRKLMSEYGIKVNY
ncbi:MAG: hypothetical protein ACOCUV_02430 [bacterium]